MKKAFAGAWILVIIFGAASPVFPLENIKGEPELLLASHSNFPCCHVSAKGAKNYPSTCHSSAEKEEFFKASVLPRSTFGFGCCCINSENQPLAFHWSYSLSHQLLSPSVVWPDFELFPGADQRYTAAVLSRRINVPLYLRNVSLLY